MKKYLVFLGLLLNLLPLLPPSYAGEGQGKEPTPGEYPAREMYNGKPGAVDLSSDPGAKRFKSRLSAGIKQGINFAGQYTIVSWGCGTNCMQSAILETKTGKVRGWFDSCGGEIYTRDSRLLIINPGAGEPNLYPSGCRTGYYVWNGTSLDRIAENR